MKNVIKQCYGCDVSKDVVDITPGVSSSDQEVKLLESRTFKNDLKGFGQLMKWVKLTKAKDVPIVFVMEATGVYHERLAYFLVDQAQSVSVVLPNRAAAFARTLEVKTITDKQASRSLCRMGLEKKLPLWRKPDPLTYQLKQLTREREQIQKSKTVCLNQIHAEKSGQLPNKESIKRLEKRLKMDKEQIKEIEIQIKTLIAANPELEKKIGFMTSIPGVGIITAATLVGETDGFSQIEGKRQLISYSGYDIVRKDSGTSVHSQPKMSKRGNRHIRRAMHYPALAAIRCNKPDKEKFVRLVSKHGIKMKAVVAVQRKLLALAYTLWKREENYDPEFESKKIGQLALP
jgi:transposase